MFNITPSLVKHKLERGQFPYLYLKPNPVLTDNMYEHDEKYFPNWLYLNDDCIFLGSSISGHTTRLLNSKTSYTYAPLHQILLSTAASNMKSFKILDLARYDHFEVKFSPAASNVIKLTAGSSCKKNFMEAVANLCSRSIHVKYNLSNQACLVLPVELIQISSSRLFDGSPCHIDINTGSFEMIAGIFKDPSKLHYLSRLLRNQIISKLSDQSIAYEDLNPGFLKLVSQEVISTYRSCSLQSIDTQKQLAHIGVICDVDKMELTYQYELYPDNTIISDGPTELESIELLVY